MRLNITDSKAKLAVPCLALTFVLGVFLNSSYSEEPLRRLTATSNSIRDLKAKWSTTQTYFGRTAKEDIVATKTVEFRTDKTRHYYKVNGWGPNDDHTQLRASNFSTAFDGSEGHFLFDKVTDKTGKGYPHGYISAADEVSENSNLHPILWAIDPNGKWPQAFSSLEFDGTDVEENVKATRYRSTNGKQVVWIDDQGRITKIELIRNGQLGDRYRFAYGQDGSSLKSSIPMSWEQTRIGPTGHIESFLSASILDVAINEGVTAEDFSIAFPVGAIVSDNRTREDMLIKHNEVKRQILPEEIYATYDEIANSETGEIKEKANWSVTMVIALLVVCIVLYGGWRTSRHRA